MELPEYVRHPDFSPNTKVVVIDKANENYGKVGLVTDIVPCRSDFTCISDYKSCPEAVRHWKVYVDIDGHPYAWFFPSAEHALEPVQKKFIDIEHLREHDIAIGDAVRKSNAGAFEPGDQIQITTKVDGANASIAWNTVKEKLDVFSRTNLLTEPGALRGFYDYIKTKVEPKTDWSQWFNLVFFGEWCVGHTIKDYNKEWFNKWRVYDIWDKSVNSYLPQTTVKNICTQLGIEYIEELYYGPFISWEHCKSFLNKSTAYGPTQEGIVIKNQTKLGIDSKYPCYLKIVNTAFAEHQHSKKEKKPIDPLEDLEKQNAANLASTIITEARIRKLILKLIDEAQLPSELKPTDMPVIMKLLPKLAFDDVLKEEKEIVVQLGKFAGKAISQQTAKLVRKIVIGSI